MDEKNNKIKREKQSTTDKTDMPESMTGTEGAEKATQIVQATQIAAHAAAPLEGIISQFKPQASLAQFVSPFVSTLESAGNRGEILAGAATVVSSFTSSSAFVNTDSAIASMANSVGMIAAAMEPYHNFNMMNSGVLTALEAAVKTPELLSFQSQFEDSIQAMGSGLSAIEDYAANLSSQWNNSLGVIDVLERSLAAQNIAIMRMFPNYSSLKLPQGSKRVLRNLTREAAKELTKTDEILFDPEEKNFYCKDTPTQKVTANQITVVESSLELFSDIGFDELVSFESQLFEDVTFAMENPLGKKIFDIINGWNKFIALDDAIYYHARKLEKGKAPFLNHEMLKAPINISSHGRYNAIGKSCYYIAETKDGAVTEIRKHSGGARPDIQVIGIRPVKSVKIIDLSQKVSGTNNFIEHLRFTVDNEGGKIIKEYLLPNFVASCCKKIGIEGIKYMSSGYCCYVLWKDDYFDFVEGSREIVRPNTH